MTEQTAVDYEALKRRVLAAIHEKLYPLWSKYERALYNSRYKESIKFGATTVLLSRHLLSRQKTGDKINIVQLGLIRAIWGQKTLNSFCKRRGIKYHSPRLECYPAGPLVELPKPVMGSRSCMGPWTTKETDKGFNNGGEGHAALEATVEERTSTAPGGQSEALATKEVEPGIKEGQIGKEGSCNNDSGSGNMD